MYNASIGIKLTNASWTAPQKQVAVASSSVDQPSSATVSGKLDLVLSVAIFEFVGSDSAISRYVSEAVSLRISASGPYEGGSALYIYILDLNIWGLAKQLLYALSIHSISS